MRVSFSRNTQNNKVVLRNQIDKIRLLFRKDRESYFCFYRILGFFPRDIKVYQQALLHKSISMRSEKGRPINNERLEFLGDAILDAIVGDIVYRHFEGRREGFLTNTRSKIVQRETLNKLAVEIGLDKLVKYSTRSSSHNSYMYGNAFEAFIGAIYLDQGYDRCKQFMEEKIFKNYIDLDKMSRKEVKTHRMETEEQNGSVIRAYRTVSRRRIQSDVPHRSPHLRDIGRHRHRLFQEGVATKCGTNGIEKN